MNLNRLATFGLSLLDRRRRRGLVLTSDGEVLYGYARRMLDPTIRRVIETGQRAMRRCASTSRARRMQ